jgi:hypothetical protein
LTQEIDRRRDDVAPAADQAMGDATGRREFIARLAKAAMVPAVVAGIAASAHQAHAGY